MSTSVSSSTPQAQGEGAAPAYTFIARTSEVEPDYALQVQVEGRPPLAVVCLEGEYFVMDDTCTHGDASMSDGEIVGCEIECPFHAGRFDIRTGAATAHPCSKALTIYPVKVENDQVFAALDAGHCADGA
ncbi:MAG: non-heme iron oxygenase ferredoxin subunit [Hydrogenophaga sp.]|uniref:non-heme iron oxygenase ferredoxin subunit n=1 Tax=Hydrogenophaga sp. TaxID=1904254 RepID=UPI0026088769|nr:non-heme iron oxygenase ferredoxin subunit [Hydrogenophaga sp.]MCW5670738.1 non-heme iron oxygenase ferredoxin subunit [Hydrogenophaga sp.]